MRSPASWLYHLNSDTLLSVFFFFFKNRSKFPQQPYRPVRCQPSFCLVRLPAWATPAAASQRVACSIPRSGIWGRSTVPRCSCHVTPPTGRLRFQQGMWGESTEPSPQHGALTSHVMPCGSAHSQQGPFSCQKQTDSSVVFFFTKMFNLLYLIFSCLRVEI